MDLITKKKKKKKKNYEINQIISWNWKSHLSHATVRHYCHEDVLLLVKERTHSVNRRCPRGQITCHVCLCGPLDIDVHVDWPPHWATSYMHVPRNPTAINFLCKIMFQALSVTVILILFCFLWHVHYVPQCSIKWWYGSL